jgi:hypothetical protein
MPPETHPDTPANHPDDPAERRTRALLALLLLVPAPTLGILAALWVPGLAETATGKTIFTLAKAHLFLFPIVWTLWVDRRRLTVPRPTWRGMGWAVGTGVAIVAVIAAAYYGYAEGQIDKADMAERMKDAGLDQPWKLLAGAVYWCTINSLLEEYVWRWFVFAKCKALTPGRTVVPILLSALFFTAHHLLAMLAYLPSQPHLAVLASLGVFIGGATWSWLYLKSRNIYAAYVSHVFADIIIFYIAYQIAFGG